MGATNSVRSTALLAAAMLGGMGAMGGAQVIPRPYYSVPGTPWKMPSRRGGNNRPQGFTFAEKKRRRKIARASRRLNLRTGF